MTPSLGRIVIVTGIDATGNNGSTEAPAVIVRVWNDVTLNLKVLTDGPEDRWLTSIPRAGAVDGWNGPVWVDPRERTLSASEMGMSEPKGQ